jgi:hypothetical protein
LFDLKMTCTAVCLSCGASTPFDGITENRLVMLGLEGSTFSNRKLKRHSNRCDLSQVSQLFTQRKHFLYNLSRIE